jgi:hypothetical protein
MTYVYVEILLYLAWPLVFITRLWRQSLAATEELLVLIFSMPLVVIMELRNEYLHAGSGVYYPSSLFYFPDFKFPFAIVLSSSLFPWLLYVTSRLIAIRFTSVNSRIFDVLQLGFLLVLNSSFVVPEWLGVVLGYWRWYTPLPDTIAVWIAKYLFYFWFTFPPALIAKLVSRRLTNPPTDQPSPTVTG